MTAPLSWQDGLAAYIERRKLVSRVNISALELAEVAERLRALERSDLMVLPSDPLTILLQKPSGSQIVISSYSAYECLITINSGSDSHSLHLPFSDAVDRVLEAAACSERDL